MALKTVCSTILALDIKIVLHLLGHGSQTHVVMVENSSPTPSGHHHHRRTNHRTENQGISQTYNNSSFSNNNVGLS